MEENLLSDQEYLLKMANTRMPFGKYKGLYLLNLPEAYLSWFSKKGFPKGELGNMLAIIYEVKINGLEYLLKPFIGKH